MNSNSVLNSAVTESGQRVSRWSFVVLGFLATLSLFLASLCLVGVVDLALRLLDQPPFFTRQIWTCSAVTTPFIPIIVDTFPVVPTPVVPTPVVPTPVVPATTPPVVPATPPVFAGLQILGSRIVFILDKSGSMGGKKGGLLEGPAGAKDNWPALRAEIKKVLVALSNEQVFALFLYDDNSYFSPENGMLAADSTAIKETMDWFNRFEPMHGTNPVPSLVLAFTSLNPDTIVLMSDGMFNEPEQVLAVIAELNAEKRVRIDTVSFPGGNEDVRSMMQKIAAENNGTWKDYIIDSRGNVP